MLKATLVIILLSACSGDSRPAPPIKAWPMLRGHCVDRVVPNLFGPGDVSYQECRWQERTWVCRLEIDGLRSMQVWRCVAVTRTEPAAPAGPAWADPTS